MRNFTKVPITYLGVPAFRLVDDDGDFDTGFDAFREHLFNQEYARATIKRYLEAVAVFLDYLVEAGVYGVATSELELNTAVDRYVVLRLHSEAYLAVADDVDDYAAEAARIARAMEFKRLTCPGNMVAAINQFLKLSETSARSEWEKAKAYGFERPGGSYREVIASVDGFTTLSSWDQKALKRASMLAGVIRLSWKGISKPRGLSAGRQRNRNSSDDCLDFPLDRLADLIGAATSARDVALWLLLASTGVRTSEALCLTWSHIDIVNRRIFVDDPNNTRFSGELPAEYRQRFKGRSVSGTYILPFLKERLFAALERYVRYEYVPGVPGDFIFQDIRSGHGRPMHMMSDTSRVQAFARAGARAGIKHPLHGGFYSPHSLRHMYGVFVRNYLPVPGGFGVTISEVMKLLGHLTDRAARHYAREDGLVLAAKLQYADAHLLQQPDIGSLPEFIAARLEHEAAQIRSRISVVA